MARKAAKATKTSTKKASAKPMTLAGALGALKKAGSKKVVDGHAQFGIVVSKTFGVPMGAIQRIAKQIGKDHELAKKLWDSGWYEARMLASYVAVPSNVTAAEMEAWVVTFDNWAVCDTVCFALWDRTPFVWAKIEEWAKRDEEFVRRAAFALIASIGVHDKGPIESKLLATLPWCEEQATDPRNFVKKGVSWALRVIGVRDAACHAKVNACATKLAASTDATARWIGNDVLRDLRRPVVAKKLAAKAGKAAKTAKAAKKPA
jgi:3-methyladenine DNA glycosylase AlkD